MRPDTPTPTSPPEPAPDANLEATFDDRYEFGED